MTWYETTTTVKIIIIMIMKTADTSKKTDEWYTTFAEFLTSHLYSGSKSRVPAVVELSRGGDDNGVEVEKYFRSGAVLCLRCTFETNETTSTIVVGPEEDRFISARSPAADTDP